jgi:hypothetical protein
VRLEGLSYGMAAHRLLYLMRRLSAAAVGVNLKDEAEVQTLESDDPDMMKGNFLLSSPKTDPFRIALFRALGRIESRPLAWSYTIWKTRPIMRIIQATLEHLDLLTPLFVKYREFYGSLPYPTPRGRSWKSACAARSR